MSVKTSPYSFLKNAYPIAPPELSQTIANASTVGQTNIPNFMEILKQFNQSNSQQIDTFTLTIRVDATNDVSILGADVEPTFGRLDSISNMVEQMKISVHKYFGKYPETINGIRPGIYSAEYQIPTVGTGISSRQK